MSDNKGVFRDTNLYSIVPMVIPIIFFIGLVLSSFYYVHSQHKIINSIAESKTLESALIVTQEKLEQLTNNQSSENISYLQRQLLTQANQTRYHLDNRIISPPETASKNERILDLSEFNQRRDQLYSLDLNEQIQTILLLLNTVIHLPDDQISTYLNRPINIKPLVNALQNEELFNLERLKEQTSHFKILLISSVIILILLVITLGYFVLYREKNIPLYRASKTQDSLHQESTFHQEEKKFIRLMSHEFRTPISAIITALELMPNMKNQQHKLIQQAEQSCYRLLNLTNNLLDVMSEEPEHDYQVGTVDLICLLDECIAPYSAHIKDKKIEFIMQCSPSVPHFIEGDAINLSKALRNVIDNAVKFTISGFINIQITTEIIQKKIFLRVKVSDSGVGIHDDIKPLIFERFFRGEQNLSNRYPGAGIGLSVVKRSMDSLSGEIEFNSTSGIGSEFTLRIPIVPIHQPVPPETKENTVQFAIVDDLEISRLHISNILTTEGYSAHCFQSGSDLLALHDKLTQYTAIFIDLYMPGINGLELIKTLYAIYGKQTPPLIVLSATPDIANIIADSGLDVWQSFVKPVDRNRIIDTLHHLAHSNKDSHETIKNAKILIVEDEPINAELLENMLYCMGHTSVIARNGESAIIEVNENHFDSVLLDINLPDLSGLEVASIIREKHPDLPIIAVTSNAYRSDKKKSSLVGIRYHLIKPVTFQELKNTLKLTLLQLD